MGNRKYDRGASLENDVANRLSDNGYAVIRAAGSGTADRDSCDVIAVNDEEILLIECKTYKTPGNNVVGHNDHTQMEEIRVRVEKEGTPSADVRDVKTVLALKQSGKFSPRCVVPFPRAYKPDGTEMLLKELYE